MTLHKLDIDTIVEHIRTGRDIVPIIGDNVFRIVRENLNTGEIEHITIQQYIIEQIAPKVQKEYSQKSDFSMYLEGYRGMSRFSKLQFLEGQGNLKTNIATLFKDKYFKEHLEMDENVKALIERGAFSLILTTCIFPWTEILEIKTGNEILDFKVYQRNKTDDIDLENGGISHPTAFYLFGMMGHEGYSANTKCVITEDDLVRFLHSLHDSNSVPQELISYFRPDLDDGLPGVRLLALGCSIPEWTFRFLLYSLKSYNAWFHKKDSDGFLGGYVDESVDNIQELLAELEYQYEREPKSLQGVINKLPGPKQNPMIFVSACNEDYPFVEQNILNKLEDKFDLWFFKRDGDHYQYWGGGEVESIEEGLKKSKFILPVITRCTLKRIELYKHRPLRDQNPGILDEWEIAIEYKVKCCPLYLNYGPQYPGEEKVDNNVFKKTIEANSDANDVFRPYFYPKAGAGGITFNNDFNSDTVIEHLKKHLHDE